MEGGGASSPLPLRACRVLKKSEVLVSHMNRTHRASYTAIHPQIVQTLNASNLRRSRPLRRSVSNLMRYSCRSVPQSTPVHPQIEHTLNASNLRRSRPLRRSVSNLLSSSCRSVPQSTPGTPKTMSRASYSLRGPTIWRESSTVFTSVRRMRQAFTGLHCQGQDRTENVLREL